MRTQRQVVDYSLQKRALLRDVQNGKVGTLEVCDASPYLKNAARFHGEPTDERCPVCRRDNLTLVHYIYGDELKHSAGQARKLAELPVLAGDIGKLHKLHAAPRDPIRAWRPPPATSRSTGPPRTAIAPMQRHCAARSSRSSRATG